MSWGWIIAALILAPGCFLAFAFIAAALRLSGTIAGEGHDITKRENNQ